MPLVKGEAFFRNSREMEPAQVDSMMEASCVPSVRPSQGDYDNSLTLEEVVNRRKWGRVNIPHSL